MTAGSSAYTTAKSDEEHILHLQDGRQMAYARNGPPDSRVIVLFFSGVLSVGTAHDVPEPCRAAGVHWIAPTLPGNGNTSTRNRSLAYHEGLAADVCALLSHLYPTAAYDQICIAGGSYGTVAAQMLYGAPYNLFPPGRKVVACVLLAGFSPFQYHKDHAKSLSWANWFSVGPPARLVPFHLLQRTAGLVVASKLKTEESARAFMRQTLYSMMVAEERDLYAQFLERKGLTEDEFVGRMARGAMTCCRNWDGFNEVSDVIYSDWGFDPAGLDEEHASKPILVVSSEKDSIGSETNAWIVANYKSAKEKTVPGGHISSIYFMDEIFQEIMAGW